VAEIRSPSRTSGWSAGAVSGTVLHDGRRFPVGSGGLTVGRRGDNAIQIDSDRASRVHARIAPADGAYYVADLGSMNGTYLNGERLNDESRWLSSGDTIVVGGEILRFLTGEATRVRSRVDAVPEHVDRVQFAGGRLTVGRDPANDVVLEDPNVSRFHAEIVGGRDGVELRDAGSTNGTRLDGRPVRRAPLVTGSEVGIGPFRLLFDGASLLRSNDRGSLRLDAERVSMAVDGKPILVSASLGVEPGQLVAIVGASGSGKTTLIKALAGVTVPTEGRVTVSGVDVRARLTDVGYVPQDDIVHGALTIREALRYSAKLRLPEDASRADVTAAVDRVLTEVALDEHADTLVRSLSGGQRKRAGVAVELLVRPSLLCLDEPTTGLDPALETRMMKLLRSLANRDRAVIVVTHATRNLHLCDRVAVMGRGGHLTFFGTPSDALEFFGASTYDGVYDALDARPAEEWRAAFETTTQVADATPYRPRALPGVKAAQRSALRQMRVLAARYLRLLRRDKRNMLLLLGQVPLLAIGAASVFKSDIFTRGPGRAGNAAQLLFLLVTTAIWLGSIDAARELVKERGVFRRERAAGLKVSAYVGSKASVLFILSAVQASALVALALALRPLHQGTSAYVQVGVALLLTSWVAVTMGLLISALARSEDQATSFIPLALVPQLFFAGAIVGVERMGQPVKALSALVFAQWSFAGIGTSVHMNGRIHADRAFARTTSYGHHFFDVSVVPAALVLLAFAALFLGVVGLLLRRSGAEGAAG